MSYSKSVAAEFFGTALLLMIVVGSGIMGEQLSAGNAAVALLGNSIATGAGLYVLITVLGPISGAHFNPAVTLMFWRIGTVPQKTAARLILAQILGGVVGVAYGFKFFNVENSPKNSVNHYWFRVGRILECFDQDLFDDLLEKVIDDAGEITPEQHKICRRNLERLYRVIWREETIAYYTESSQSYDKVLDIFIRANDGGTKLSKSDLLMSMVTLKWSTLNARDEINQFLDNINTKLDKKNDVDRDFILRSGLVLSELEYGFSSVAN